MAFDAELATKAYIDGLGAEALAGAAYTRVINGSCCGHC